jgi:hypothetical protein
LSFHNSFCELATVLQDLGRDYLIAMFPWARGRRGSLNLLIVEAVRVQRLELRSELQGIEAHEEFHDSLAFMVVVSADVRSTASTCAIATTDVRASCTCSSCSSTLLCASWLTVQVHRVRWRAEDVVLGDHGEPYRTV